jgi:pimeloyl-ACP methyl ester carboxylesterase
MHVANFIRRIETEIGMHNPVTSIRIYSYYGSIGAPFPRGLGYSRGLDRLGERLAAIPGIVVLPTQANWLSQREFMRDAGEHPGARKVCIGHSMGCYAVTRLAARTPNITWDLLIAFEPAPGYNSLGAFPCPPLRGNVRRAICFRSTNWLNPIGHGRLRKARDFKGELTIVDVATLHHRIAGHGPSHETCIAAIRALAVREETSC